MENKLDAAAWINAARVEDWLLNLWPDLRPRDITYEMLPDGTWYWSIADYAAGRSRLIAVAPGLLGQLTSRRVAEILDKAQWRKKIEENGLLISKGPQGFEVATWPYQPNESWVPDPRGGHFVARVVTRGGVSVGSPPPPPRTFLLLQGDTWSAAGAEGPRSASSYGEEELRAMLAAFGTSPYPSRFSFLTASLGSTCGRMPGAVVVASDPPSYSEAVSPVHA